MAQLTYAEFKAKYQHGYGLATSTKIKDAWRQYLLKGTLPTSTAPIPEEEVPEEEPVEEPIAPPTEDVGPGPPAPEVPTAPPEVPPIPELPTPPTVEAPPELVPPEMPEAPTIEIPEPPEVPTIEVPEAPIPPAMPEVPTIEAPPPPVPPEMPAPPTIEMPGAPTPPEMPEVPEVPPYERLPSQVALEEEYGEALSAWREAKGYGIPEETQAQMLQRATDILKARETESIRVMKNNMESREITNSGYIFANEMTIKSNTTVAIANYITDVQIKSAMMRMASFEKAMGATSQFMGYLSEQSQLINAPKFAQWQAETQYRLVGHNVAAQYKLAGYNAQVSGVLAQAQIDAQYGLTGAEIAAQYGLTEYQAQVSINMAQAQMAAQYGLTAVQIAAQYGLTEYQAQVSINTAQAQIAANYGMMGYNAEVSGVMAQAQIDAQYGLTAVEIAAQYGLSDHDAQLAVSLAQANIDAQYGLTGYQALMTGWQAQVDLIKIELNQAYTQDNMILAGQIATDAQEDEQAHEITLAEMELEAAQQAAAAEGAGNLFGTTLGWILGEI